MDAMRMVEVPRIGWRVADDGSVVVGSVPPLELPAGVRWIVRAYCGACEVGGYNVPDWALPGHIGTLGERFPVRPGERVVCRTGEDLTEYLECVEA